MTLRSLQNAVTWLLAPHELHNGHDISSVGFDRHQCAQPIRKPLVGRTLAVGHHMHKVNDTSAVDEPIGHWQRAVRGLCQIGAEARLARYGDVIGEKTGLGQSWIGVVLLAATTSLPELFTGFSATALSPLPNIAIGDVVGSCMFNLLILSFMDAIQPEPLSARAHQGHALSIGFGLLLIGIAGISIVGAAELPSLGWISPATPLLAVLYFVSMKVIFAAGQRVRATELQEVAEELRYAEMPLRTAVVQYVVAAVVVVVAALWLPRLGAAIADRTGLGEAFVGSLFIAVT